MESKIVIVIIVLFITNISRHLSPQNVSYAGLSRSSTVSHLESRRI